MSLLLSSDIAQNNDVPKEYNMHVMERNPASTFIFTEKDLPGYSIKGKGNNKPGQHLGGFPSSRMPSQTAFQDRSRQATNQADKGKRWQPYFRKAIPSKLQHYKKIRLLLMKACIRENSACWANSKGD